MKCYQSQWVKNLEIKLNNKINFIQITEVVQEVLSKIEFSSNEDLDYLISSDKNAREFTKNIIRNLS